MYCTSWNFYLRQLYNFLLFMIIIVIFLYYVQQGEVKRPLNMSLWTGQTYRILQRNVKYSKYILNILKHLDLKVAPLKVAEPRKNLMYGLACVLKHFTGHSFGYEYNKVYKCTQKYTESTCSLCITNRLRDGSDTDRNNLLGIHGLVLIYYSICLYWGM